MDHKLEKAKEDDCAKAKETSNDDSTRAAGDAPQIEGGPQEKMSKSQMKKKRRLERMKEVKKRRKQQEKEVKIAKAQAQGRNLEQERKFAEERRLEGHGKKRRQEKWEQTKLPLAKASFQVCLDCAYESSMTPKEIGSLALQIRYCYASNKRSPHPCLLAATSLSGATWEHLKNVSGYEEWSNRAFTCTEKSLEEYYRSNMDNVVYLTSDSENLLADLDDSKIYVIGGIVDRNRLKRAALERANKLGISTTARLPLDEHLQKMESTRVLTCNHVFEILLKYREHGRDWKKALLDVLPNRKDAKI